jgi:signal transduction histidine kinase
MGFDPAEDRVNSDHEIRAAQRRVIAAGDDARREVAKNLHDGAQQDFVTVVINLQLAQLSWDSDAARARMLVQSALDHARLGVKGLRQLVDGIHPLILTNRGLGAAVEAFAGRLPLPVRLVALPPERFDAGIEVGLYFMVAEALTNTVKHSEASLATVSFELDSAQLAVEVTDDGVGGADFSSGTRGLTGLADRIGALGGTLSLASEPGAGTVVRASVPLAAGPQPTLM